MGGKVLVITKLEDLKTQLESAGSKLVVIDFFADWCGPCKQIGPKIEKLAEDESMQDVIFIKINVDECAEDLTMTYEVESLPTFLFLKQSAKLDTLIGANFEKLQDIINTHK